ncbi:MAG: gliding motility protein GldC [Chitinophagaceae bacterium]|jgi:gliding motility-associated protein GldC
MTQSTITIDVNLDEQKIPHQIMWNATQSNSEAKQEAKAMMISFWDGKERAALRIDLWTKEMMVDEMADFYYQTMMTMADTFDRATHQTELVGEMKSFAKTFYTKFKKTLEQQ